MTEVWGIGHWGKPEQFQANRTKGSNTESYQIFPRLSKMN